MPEIDPATLIFAAVAIFVVLKLRSVLGSRPGGGLAPPGRAPDVAPPSAGARVLPFPTAPRAGAPSAQPVGDRWAGIAAPGTPLRAGLDRLASADPNFSAETFVGGARRAYETIIGAFAAGDVATLRGLLTNDTANSFESAIKPRQAAGHKAETTLVSIDKCDIIGADASAGTAKVTLRFDAQIVSVVRDREGRVVEGSPSDVVHHADLWTFERLVASGDPNWRLSAAESAA